jgi:adenosine kinase
VLETIGTQEYTVEPERFIARLTESYGEVCAKEVRAKLIG